MSLKTAWDESKYRSFDFTGGLTFRPAEQANDNERSEAFNTFLWKSVCENPNLFKGYSNKDIVDVLLALNKVNPCTNVLIALYAAYDPNKNHELKAWELDRRIAFLNALDQDAEILAITSKWHSESECPGDDEKKLLASRQLLLQTNIFGAKPAIAKPYDEPKPPTGDYGNQNIWSASYWREGNTLFYNTYLPKDPRELFCTFRKTSAEFQSTIAHDTDHIVQEDISERVLAFLEEQSKKSRLGEDLPAHMAQWVDENLHGGLDNEINRMILESEEMRNFGLLMHYSVHLNYYLSQKYGNGDIREGVTFEAYQTNPSESHTFDLQDDVDRFLAPGADRKKILQEIEDLRQFHLQQTTKIQPSIRPEVTAINSIPTPVFAR